MAMLADRWNAASDVAKQLGSLLRHTARRAAHFAERQMSIDSAVDRAIHQARQAATTARGAADWARESAIRHIEDSEERTESARQHIRATVAKVRGHGPR